MARPVQRGYGKWTVTNQSPRPLLPISEERQSSSNDDNAADPFEKLLKSPPKRDVDFRPLSHWAKKVEELSSKEKKSKALYDFSSPDETQPSTKKKPRKPKPRKKKENLLDNIYKNIMSGTKRKENLSAKIKKNVNSEAKKNRPALVKIENERSKESIFVKKAQNNLDKSLLLFKHPPSFGLCSTPGQGIPQKLVKPSYFDFVSPIVNQITPISSQGNILADTPVKRSSPKIKLGSDYNETAKRRAISESMSPDSLPDNGNLSDASHGSKTPDRQSGFDGLSRDLCPTLRLTPIDKKPTQEHQNVDSDGSHDCETPDQQSGFHGFSPRDFCPILRLTPIDKKPTQQRQNVDSSSGEMVQNEDSESPPSYKNITFRRKNLQSTLMSSIDDVTNGKKSENVDSSLKSSSAEMVQNEDEDVSNGSKSEEKFESPLIDKNVTRRRGNLWSTLQSAVIERTHSSPIHRYMTRRRKSHTVATLPDELSNDTLQETRHNDSDILRRSSVCVDSQQLNFDDSVKLFEKLDEDQNEILSSPNYVDVPDLSDCSPRSLCQEHHSEAESTMKQPSDKSIICSESTEDSELCKSSPKKYATKRRNILEKGNLMNGQTLPKRRSKIGQSPVGEDTEKSHYFKKVIEETSPSDSSVIYASSSETESHLNKTEIRKTSVSPAVSDEPSGVTPVGNRTLLPLGSLVLKGGKNHTRALSVLRQINAGRLTIHNQSIMMQALPGRGRAYESFVGSLLESQPGFEQSIMRAASPETRKSRYSRTRSSCLAQARQSIVQNSSMRNRLSVAKPLRSTRVSNNFVGNSWANRTVHWQDSVVRHPRESAVANTFNESRMNRTQFCNVSVCVVPAEKHEPTAFRAAYGIEDVQTSAREVTLARCGQDAPVDFSEYFNERTLPDCVKIGEGVYGEVFMYNSKEYGPTVFKVIPIEGDLLVNDEPQKTFKEILSEVVSTMELSNLRYGKQQNCSGFVELRKCLCVKGEYPELLMDLWCEYDMKKGSDNDSPSNFEENQLYIVLELAHGGQDLESFVFQNAKQSAAAFRQATLSLAVAERALQFEHRDFHWGNVLLSPTTERKIKYILDGVEYVIPSEGVKLTIIDFTLSRMTFEGCSVFNDLSVDPGLFTSEGEYQFEIYRMMKEETGNNWELFKPRTNIFWLHYTLDKMSTIVRYKRPRSKLHQGGMKILSTWKNLALDYASAAELVPML